ncbi:MAG: hypothetical protein JST17_10535 [Bacteroidetes bacterium]|nr:hypothetical protein [Bacteroidota bacterium]MBS1930332.1 hypothetical protein [Bacteroidota bacterium]
MRKISAFLLCACFYLEAQSQSLKKYEINNSGCAVYMYCTPEQFKEAYSDDSSKVYTAECNRDEFYYGVICVRLLTPSENLGEAEDMLISYLDYLKTSFDIKSAVGYGRGNHLNNREDTRGVVDYWKDDLNNNWKIKAWTNGKFIGVLYVYSAKELPETKVDVFLNSFRFPGM